MGKPITPSSFRLCSLWLAGVLALASNYFFTGELFSRSIPVPGNVWESRHSVASICLIAAIVLAAFGFGTSRAIVSTVSENGVEPGKAGSRWRWWHFLPGAVFYLAANLIYLDRAESTLVHVLWWAGIIGFLAPLVRRAELGSLLTLSLPEYLLVVAITGVAFALRYTDLMNLPLHIDNDVAIMGQYSQRMLQTGNARWIGMAPTDHPFSEHQFLVTSMRLFGPGQYGLVMLTVLAGTATVPLLYLVGRSFFNRWVGLIAACFLCADYVNIHFSRILFGPLPTFFLVLSGVFFARGVRRSSALSFGLAGAAAGACLLDYYSGRVVPVIYAGLFVAWFFQRKKYPHIPLSFWFIALGGLLAVFGPNLGYSLRFSTMFSGRTTEVVIWSDSSWEHISRQIGPGVTTFRIWLEQTRHALLAPFYYPDQSTICYLREPMLGVFAGVSCALGLGYCFRHSRDLACLFALLMIGFTFIFGGILTTNPPFWPHLNIAAPALALVAAIGVQAFASHVLALNRRWIHRAVPPALLILLVGSGVQNWNTYTVFARNYIGGEPLAARQIRLLPRNYRVWLVSPVARWSGPLFQFLDSGVSGGNLPEDILPSDLPPIDQPTAIYLFPGPNHQRWMDFLLTKYPQATKQVFRDAWHSEAFTVFQLYPRGYVEVPTSRVLSTPEIQKTFGGQLLLLALVGAGFVGGAIYRRERRDRQRFAVTGAGYS